MRFQLMDGSDKYILVLTFYREKFAQIAFALNLHVESVANSSL